MFMYVFMPHIRIHKGSICTNVKIDIVNSRTLSDIVFRWFSVLICISFIFEFVVLDFLRNRA